MKRLFEYAMRLTGKYDRELADSVLDVSIRANAWTAKSLLEGGEEMSGALLELMEPIIQQKETDAWNSGNSQGLSQGINQGIQGAVHILQSVGLNDQEIKNKIMEEYNLSETATAEYLAPRQPE